MCYPGVQGGRGLQVTLAEHTAKFSGVLNGIDTEAWDPLTDPLIEQQFDWRDLGGKAANKSALRAYLGLDLCLGGDKPLVGCITRLVPQKGVHLIRHSIYRTLSQGGQFVLLGSSPVPDIQVGGRVLSGLKLVFKVLRFSVFGFLGFWGLSCGGFGD